MKRAGCTFFVTPCGWEINDHDEPSRSWLQARLRPSLIDYPIQLDAIFVLGFRQVTPPVHTMKSVI